MEKILIKRVETLRDLKEIKVLQNNNLKNNLSEEEKSVEGFVTAEYSLEFLQQMHELEASIVAIDTSINGDSSRVVGYILAVPRSIQGHQHRLLDDMMDNINQSSYHGTSLNDMNYLLVGQVCVAKGYRGQGLLQKMYQYYREALSPRYPCCITEVDESNQRSVKAHLKTGFEIIRSTTTPVVTWLFVLWNWRV